jgi:hypothetical protein
MLEGPREVILGRVEPALRVTDEPEQLFHVRERPPDGSPLGTVFRLGEPLRLDGDPVLRQAGGIVKVSLVVAGPRQDVGDPRHRLGLVAERLVVSLRGVLDHRPKRGIGATPHHGVRLAEDLLQERRRRTGRVRLPARLDALLLRHGASPLRLPIEHGQRHRRRGQDEQHHRAGARGVAISSQQDLGALPGAVAARLDRLAGEVSPDVLRQLAGALVAPVGPPGQAALDDRLDVVVHDAKPTRGNG